MKKMQFRGFVFPSNPESILLKKEHRVVSHFCPGHGEVLQSMGELADRVVCEGSFWSQSVDETTAQIDRFLEVSEKKQPGLLFLPFGPPLYCYLKEILVRGEGDGRIVPYTMVFVKAGLDA